MATLTTVEDTSAAKTLEDFRSGVLLAVLCGIQRKTEEPAHTGRKLHQVFVATTDPF